MNGSTNILIVEDNLQLRKYIGKTLESSGYLVTLADSGESAISRLRHEDFDLVLLDLMLGDTHGLEILKLIRRQNEFLPVIIVSTCTDVSVKVDGFQIGCDDYLTKPFYSDELLVRVQRQLKRREQIRSKQNVQFIEEDLTLPPFSLNLRTCEVYKEGVLIEMRQKLFDILLFLAQSPNQTIAKETILHHCWENWEEASSNTLYVHIRQLRSLIEDNPDKPAFLQTVRGRGFRLSIPSLVN